MDALKQFMYILFISSFIENNYNNEVVRKILSCLGIISQREREREREREIEREIEREECSLYMGVGIACLYPSESHPWCHRLVCECGVSKLINLSPSLDRLVGLTYIKQSRQRRHL